MWLQLQHFSVRFEGPLQSIYRLEGFSCLQGLLCSCYVAFSALA